MLINLSEVFTLEGKEKTWEVPFEAKAYKGSRVEYPVVSANPVKITVKNLGNRKLSLTGNTSVTLAIPCSRCLEPVNYTTDIEFDQEIDMNASDEDRVKDLDEQSYLSGYNLDADMLVCNELSLYLPMKVLCKDDCKGICSKCGANLNKGDCGCDTWVPDPRMAAIQDIFKQFKEVQPCLSVLRINLPKREETAAERTGKCPL